MVKKCFLGLAAVAMVVTSVCGVYATPSTTYIYSDRVAIIVWSPDPMAFLIRSRVVADSYRKYFDVLWKTAKP